MAQRQSELLEGVVVVDAAQGMCTTLIAKVLGDLGATVIRPPMAEGDPFIDVYPAMRAWREGFETPESDTPQNWHELAARADVLILGGEDYPGLKRTGGAAELCARHSRLIALELTALPQGMPDRACHAHELLVQARSGLVWEYHSSRPVPVAFNPATYGAVFQALSAILAALVSRERSGKGQAVWTSLLDGAFMFGASLWLDAERPTPSARLIVPKNPRPMILGCADGNFVHVYLAAPPLAAELYKVLGLPLPEAGVKLWASQDPRDFFGVTEEIVAAAAKWKREELIKALTEVNITAGAVLHPGECWADAQIVEQQLISATADGQRYLGPVIKSRPSQPGSGLADAAADAAPLSGLSVVDFGTYVAGPYSAVVLGDLGADVIKVEPKGGDLGRGMYRIFSVCNRSKRTIRIDLTDPMGAEIVQKLCLRADVVMSNFRTGVSARRGVDAASLHPKRPELVILEAPAYGATGPRAKQPGFDPIMQAWTGHEVRQGGQGNAPVWTRFTGIDYGAGALAGIAVLAGLYHRAAHGVGHEVISTLVGGSLFMMSEMIQEANGAFAGAPLLDSRQQGMHPAEAIYQTADGWIAVVALSVTTATAMASALGCANLAELPRESWGEAAQTELAGALRRFGTAEALALLDGAGVWAEPCPQGQPEKWIADPFLQSQGLIRQFEHAQMGRVAEVGTLFRMQKSPVAPSRPAPDPGEHSRTILAELGYGPAEIDALFASGVVG